jgi:hypothetical protein
VEKPYFAEAERRHILNTPRDHEEHRLEVGEGEGVRVRNIIHPDLGIIKSVGSKQAPEPKLAGRVVCALLSTRGDGTSMKPAKRNRETPNGFTM